MPCSLYHLYWFVELSGIPSQLVSPGQPPSTWQANCCSHSSRFVYPSPSLSPGGMLFTADSSGRLFSASAGQPPALLLQSTYMRNLVVASGKGFHGPPLAGAVSIVSFLLFPSIPGLHSTRLARSRSLNQLNFVSNQGEVVAYVLDENVISWATRFQYYSIVIRVGNTLLYPPVQIIYLIRSNTVFICAGAVINIIDNARINRVPRIRPRTGM